MTAIKRRNRLLALRLTDEEYDRLKAACAISGGHNLSEFTRSELLNLVDEESVKVEARVSLLENKMAELEESVRDLRSR